jgi:2-polyprenyl-3-methyl-5-hydroxy-6-metoxy-1,4-benzoquinol methylase
MSRDYSSKKILHENAYVYDDYYRVGIIDGWAKEDKAYNFRHIVKIAEKSATPLRGATVLDVGCGTGDIIPTLRARHIKNYTGVDIYKPALRIAKRKFPGEKFLFSDILVDRTLGKYDFVLCSGGMSIKLKSINNYDFLRNMVHRMWQMAKKGVAFNLLTTEDVAPARHLFYYDIEKVRAMCKEIAPNAIVRIRRTPIFNGADYEDEAQIHVYMTPLHIS